MNLIVTGGREHAIRQDALAAVRHALAQAGLATEEPEWLAPEAAVRFSLPASSGGMRSLPGTIADVVAAYGLDANLLAPRFGKARLFLADMDSTMIEQECIDELADFVGLKPQVSAITERAMRGEIAFEPALRERVALLKGLPVTVIDRIIADRIVLTPGGRSLLATMKAGGTHTCLVSGGFTLFTARIAAMLGFDEHYANELVVENGLLTGLVREPILGKEAKRARLIALREQLGLAAHETLAVGDGANDLDMLGEAGLGVAFRAKPAVAAAAHARIDQGDLSALLFLQGYRAENIVAG